MTPPVRSPANHAGPSAAIFLHSRSGAVGDHRAMMVDDPAQGDRSGHSKRRDCYCDKAGAVEYARQQNSEDRKTRDPDYRGDETQQDS